MPKGVYIRTEKTRASISKASKKLWSNPTHRKRMSDVHKGKPLKESTKKKMSEVRTGERNPFYGRKHNEDSRKRMSESAKRKFEKFPELRDKMSALAANRTGEKSFVWKGGLSFEPYCPKFNDAFRERVRKYFDYTCAGCGKYQVKPKLSVHHVNFHKMSCCDGVVPLFVPLCRSCHAKTNFNREYWEQHYTNGRCYIPGTSIDPK